MFTDGKPDLPLALLAEFTAVNFDLRTEMTQLNSERDQNVALIGPSRAYVLKVSHLADDLPFLELQNALMQAAAQYEVLPQVPEIVPSRRGRSIEFLEYKGQRYPVRLLTLLPGVSAASVPGTTELWNDVGRSAAHLGKALLDVDSDLHRPLLWNITSTAQVRPLLRHIVDDAERRLLGSVLDDAEATTLPHLARLPRQWIHNDLNLNNLLVDPNSPSRVCGIIDFGDMVAAPRIVELAIAAAHQCGRERDHLPAIGTVVAAYNAVSELSETEIGLVPQLICLRLAMAVVIRNARAVTTSSFFDPADYARLLRTVSALEPAGRKRCIDHIYGAIRARAAH